MISLEDCKAYLSECQALAEEAKLSLRRATAVIAVCHGSRCVTRFLHTKLSPPRKMLLKRFRDSLRVV